MCMKLEERINCTPKRWSQMELAALFIAFNQLKERLKKEGLFNPNFKQPIPKFPKTVGVLTATTGAAIRDICTTIKRRYPQAEIVFIQRLVQGAMRQQILQKIFNWPISQKFVTY